MARMLSNFNAKDAEKMGDFTPIDAGQYTAQITKSEMKETKNADGHYLSLQFQILGSDFDKRVVFERLNIDNKNPQTVEIAQKALATICEICNVDNLEDSEQLHNIPMLIKVTVKPAQAQYAAQNEIKGFQAHEGDIPQSSAPTGAATPPTNQVASAGGSTPPWKK